MAAGAETFKEILGFPNYRVSSRGRVQSRQHRGTKKLGGWRDIKSFSEKGRYCVVSLSHNKNKKSFYIHRLVAQAFIEQPSKNLVVNHRDLDKHNNRVENLEWITMKENTRHAFLNRTIKRGGESYASALNEISVLTIRTLSNAGWKNKDIAKHYGIKNNTVSGVKSGVTWKHLPVIQ